MSGMACPVSRSAALTLSALLLSVAGPSLAAVRLGPEGNGAREEAERARIREIERPNAVQGLQGLREQTRSALRPAKIENKADGKVLVATTTASLADLKVVGRAPQAMPRIGLGERLSTNVPELLAVKALTKLGATHESLARFAKTQGQDGIQVGFGKIYRLEDALAHAEPDQSGKSPRRRPQRHRAPTRDAEPVPK